MLLRLYRPSSALICHHATKKRRKRLGVTNIMFTFAIQKLNITENYGNSNTNPYDSVNAGHSLGVLPIAAKTSEIGLQKENRAHG